MWGGDDSPTYAELRGYADEIGLDPDSGLGALGMAAAVLRDDPSAPWEVSVTWQPSGPETEASWTPVAVELRARTGQPVTADAWRSVRVGQVVEDTRHRLAWGLSRAGDYLAQHEGPAAAAGARSAADRLADQPEGTGPGRPPTYDDDHYREVGAVYRAAVRTGSRRPRRAVADVLADRYPGADARGDTRAKAWVREARRRGYIEQEG